MDELLVRFLRFNPRFLFFLIEVAPRDSEFWLLNFARCPIVSCRAGRCSQAARLPLLSAGGGGLGSGRLGPAAGRGAEFPLVPRKEGVAVRRSVFQRSRCSCPRTPLGDEHATEIGGPRDEVIVSACRSLLACTSEDVSIFPHVLQLSLRYLTRRCLFFAPQPTTGLTSTNPLAYKSPARGRQADRRPSFLEAAA